LAINASHSGEALPPAFLKGKLGRKPLEGGLGDAVTEREREREREIWREGRGGTNFQGREREVAVGVNRRRWRGGGTAVWRGRMSHLRNRFPCCWAAMREVNGSHKPATQLRGLQMSLSIELRISEFHLRSVSIS